MNQSPPPDNLATTNNAHTAKQNNLNPKKNKKKTLKQAKDNKAHMITNIVLEQLKEMRPFLTAKKTKEKKPWLGILLKPKPIRLLVNTS